MPNQPESPGAAVSPSRGGRHQVKRSITEVASPKRQQSRNSTSHHHHHHPFHYVPLNYSRHRREKTVDAGLPQSAHPVVNRNSLDMWRSDAGSRNQSRRGSQLVVKEKEDESRSALNRPDKTNQALNLPAEQAKASLRVDGLKQSLSDLHTFSTTAGRRLDETYYAVLEKMSSLQNTIAMLKDLAESSRDTHTTFEKIAGSLESDITRQLYAFGQFDDQQTKIESLQERIKGGRSKIQTLSDRVDTVRRRVESWERADREWQERTRRRLRVTWTVFFAVIVVVVAILVSVNLGSEEAIQELPDKVGSGKYSEGVGAISSMAVEDTPMVKTDFPWEKVARTNDDRLRGLDEL